MADSLNARSVSGEMMTPGSLCAEARESAAGIVDADYVEIGPQERREGQGAGKPDAAAAQPPGGMGMLDRSWKPAVQWTTGRGGPVFWAAGCLLVAAAFWMSGGHALMRPAAPDRSDLRIADVRSITRTIDGTPALLVDGRIHNAGSAAGRVPDLAVRVRSRTGAATVYKLGSLRTPLPAGANYSFSGRLDLPMDGVETVSVTFDQ
ncbi:hypothetical protein [Vibrio sp.]|uniref:hypothetical protein n=1 Tax=Vibrio sp. TaxID=678 RepID=UPI003A87520A